MEASKAKESPQTREYERFPVHQSSGRGSNDKKMKEENRSLYLEEKHRLPLEVPLGTTADRATKPDSQGENPSVKTEQNLPKVTPAISRKDRSRTVKVKEATTEPDQRDQVEKKIPKPFKFVKDEIKMEGWQYEELTKMYEWKCSRISYQATQYSKCRSQN